MTNFSQFIKRVEKDFIDNFSSPETRRPTVLEQLVRRARVQKETVANPDTKADIA